MEMTGEYRIPARRDAVWRALNDPDVLRACIPGCEELTRTAEDAMSAKVVAKVGPVKATFVGNVTLTNVNPPESYTISGEGKGGVAGFAKGGADVRLAEDGDATLLTYVVKGQVGGKLAQLGSRLIDSTAKKMADDFFGAFATRLSGDEPTMASSLTTPTSPDAADAAATEELTDRIEHKIDDEALDLGEVAEEIEEEVEVAASRGFLGGPYVWGLLALLVVIVFLAVASR
ncbi:SRPBCC family protein [Kaistia granuli]|uniref:SRPBCC family protein n=1 Tax=Kaistia granuli TaxID=363259 RepID=UPI0003A172E0|nr:carbon monoxide dehydrogenase subunit G [Kaistia granuli]